MIDIKLVRENPEMVKENIKKKFQDQKLVLVDEVIDLDQKVRDLKKNGDALRSKRNSISNEIGQLMRDKKVDEANDKKEEVKNLEIGVDIGEYITKPAKVKILKTDEEKNISRLEITIHEGKNRQVRKMCEAIGHSVLALHRSKIAGIGVKDIPLRKMEIFK